MREQAGKHKKTDSLSRRVASQPSREIGSMLETGNKISSRLYGQFKPSLQRQNEAKAILANVMSHNFNLMPLY
jgi:hypothetical protein